MADSSSLIGQTISHYRILEKVGEGGMGVVYKAHDLHLDRLVALKLLPSEKLADETRRQRFVQEAKSASALNHPNIIHIYDVTEANGKPFLAMEYVSGRTLSQVIARKGVGLHDALKIATQIADALAKAHAAGIVDSDLKPSNIMVTQDGLVKVLDFGLAKLTETNSEDSIETRSTNTTAHPGQKRVSSWGQRAICRRNRPKASPRMHARIFSRSGSCCTRCCQAGELSKARIRCARWPKFCVRNLRHCMNPWKAYRQS